MMPSSTPNTKSHTRGAGSRESVSLNNSASLKKACDVVQDAGSSMDQKTQEMLRNHSFQLVKLQSELHELRALRAKDAEKNAGLVSEMKDLYGSMAHLKGKLADLTMELHSLKDSPSPRPRTSTSRIPIRPPLDLQERWRVNEFDNKTIRNTTSTAVTAATATPIELSTATATTATTPIIEPIREARMSHVPDYIDEIETLADKFLKEQRPRLIEFLKEALIIGMVQIRPPKTQDASDLRSRATASSVESAVEKTPVKREWDETLVDSYSPKHGFSIETPPRGLTALFKQRSSEKTARSKSAA